MTAMKSDLSLLETLQAADAVIKISKEHHLIDRRLAVAYVLRSFAAKAQK